MSCNCGASYYPAVQGGCSPAIYSGFFAGYNACTGLQGGWNGGGYANWNNYGSPAYGFRGCQNSLVVGLGGDGNGVGF
jgi:hypothetical protein